MKRIRNYEDFMNEELNFRKALVGAAIGASVLGGMSSCNKEDIKPNIELTIKQNLLKGNWKTSFKYWVSYPGQYFNTNSEEESFSCEISFKENGKYIISNRKTGNKTYSNLVEGNYEIFENYYGKESALVLNNSEGDTVYFKVSENPAYSTINPGAKYYLEKEVKDRNDWYPTNRSIMKLLGVTSQIVYDPDSFDNIPVSGITSQGILYDFPDIEIIKK